MALFVFFCNIQNLVAYAQFEILSLELKDQEEKLQFV